MKTIIVLTDFSDNAASAAQYALHLAKKVNANLLLCNTFPVHAQMPAAYAFGWPAEEYNVLNAESTTGLNELKKLLDDQVDGARLNNGHHPKINILSFGGDINEAVNEAARQTEVNLVVAGMHNKDLLSGILLENHVNSLINSLNYPLLLIPPDYHFEPIKKVGFATDMHVVENDMKALEKLTSLIRPLFSEILLTNVDNEGVQDIEFMHWKAGILKDITDKLDYPYFDYSVLRSQSIENGLNYLCEHNGIAMLAMIHHRHSFLDRIFKRSYSKKMAEKINIPLMIFPE